MICATLALFATAVTAQPAQPVPAAPTSGSRPATPAVPMVGVAWYPEQWPEARWDADLALMQAAHVSFVRIGEFAWSTLEPREGVYQLDWLERAVRAAERHHIAVVLGTPTAAPPAWLTSAYPETLRTLRDGSRAKHGGRHQADNFNPRFRALAGALVERMAARFGGDPNVIGWQVDNEPGSDDFSAGTRTQFQDWLRHRYGTLDALNVRWTTAYWSQTYSDWKQIPFPETRDANPGLMLAWRQFLSDADRSYLRGQRDVIRAHAGPRQRITTNLWIDARAKTAETYSPDADAEDLYTLNADFDFASWDEYVGIGHFDPARMGLTHDVVRGLLHRDFWVMETQPGTVNWSDNNNSLDKGEVRALAWHAVGHGADAVAYWQWRSALNGQEQYHGVLVGADGTPVPVYDEVAQVAGEFARTAPALAGTSVAASVAVLNDYSSRWAIGWQRFARDFIPANALFDYYQPLHDLTHAVDVVAAGAPLDRYKLVVAPALDVLTPAAADNLAAYVRAGGSLVLGARTGLKDGDNGLWPERQPGPLAALLGARVAQWYALERPVPVAGSGRAGQASTWAERLDVLASDVEVLLRYGASNGWLDGQPAAVTRRVGKGRITYVGATLDPALTAALLRRLITESGVAPVLPGLPDGVDAGLREGGGHKVLILTNTAADPRRVTLPGPMRDLLDPGERRVVTLPRYGVAVLEADAK